MVSYGQWLDMSGHLGPMGGHECSVMVNDWSQVVNYGKWVVLSGQLWSKIGHDWSPIWKMSGQN